MADYYGVFENAGLQSPTNFAVLQPELVSRNMNATAFSNTNSVLSSYLDPADAAGNYAVLAHHALLINGWFEDDTATIDDLRALIYPLADAFKNHPATLGYNVYDDAPPSLNEKLKAACDVFAERDVNNPASPMLVGGRNGFSVYDYVRPGMMLFYKNNFTKDTASCDMLNATGKLWSEIVRELVQMKPDADELHLLLQAHETNTGPSITQLRYPSLAEMRILFGQGLGEEANGLYWFTRSTLPGEWEGLIDRPEAYDQAEALGLVFNALKPTLATIWRVPDRFRVDAPHYIVTFRSRTDSDLYYALVVRVADTSGTIAVTSDWFDGTLRDVVTDDAYALGASIPFDAGETRLFVLDDFEAGTPPAVATNLLTNPSFEAIADGTPSGWGSGAGTASDTEIFYPDGGGASFRFDGSGSGTLIERNQAVDLEPNTHYVLSYRMKTQNLDASLVGVDFRQITPSTILMGEMSFLRTGSEDWQQFMEWFTTPANNGTNQIRIHTTLKEDETVWFDAFWIVPYYSYFPDEYRAPRLLGATLPSIVTSPQNRTITSGSRAQLSVAADGTPPLEYQWYVGVSGNTDTPIDGATSASYTTDALTESASYWARVSNEAGSVDSATATVTVQAGGSFVWLVLAT